MKYLYEIIVGHTIIVKDIIFQVDSQSDEISEYIDKVGTTAEFKKIYNCDVYYTGTNLL